MIESLIGILFSSMFAVIGVICLLFALRMTHTIYQVLTASTLSAANIQHADGDIEFTGRVVPIAETLTAPVSGNDVVFYHARAKYHSRSNRPRWRTFTQDVDSVPFILQNDTGRVGVHLGYGDNEVGRHSHNPLPNQTDRKITPRELSEREDEFLRRDNGKKHLTRQLNDLKGGKHLRLIEERVEPGDTVCVVGTVMPDQDDRRVIAADRIAESKNQGIIKDTIVSIFFAVFGFFMISTFFFVGLPELVSLF